MTGPNHLLWVLTLTVPTSLHIRVLQLTKKLLNVPRMTIYMKYASNPTAKMMLTLPRRRVQKTVSKIIRDLDRKRKNQFGNGRHNRIDSRRETTGERRVAFVAKTFKSRVSEKTRLGSRRQGSCGSRSIRIKTSRCESQALF